MSCWTELGPTCPLPALSVTYTLDWEARSWGTTGTGLWPSNRGVHSLPVKRVEQKITATELWSNPTLGPHTLHTAVLMRLIALLVLKSWRSSGSVCTGSAIHLEKTLQVKRQRMIRQQKREKGLLSFSVRKVTGTWYHFTVCTKNLGKPHLLVITSQSWYKWKHYHQSFGTSFVAFHFSAICYYLKLCFVH